jgi:D-glycero-D-manno-heptose 1,7-bisphosphate phosphatase
MKNRAVFLDRDGVINEIVYHREMGIIDSPFTIEQFKLLPQVNEAISKIHRLGYITVLISNQPGIAKKKYDIKTFNKIRQKMRDELAKYGVGIDAEYYCLHHPNGKISKYTKVCDCRKPKPGLIIRAAKDLNIDLSKSWLIGDGITDIQAGKAAGCKTIIISQMKCDICKLMEEKKIKPDFIAPNLYNAVLIIEKN